MSRQEKSIRRLGEDADVCESKNRPFGDQNEANKLIAIMTSRRESIKGVNSARP
jgi:hypothetical protein